MQGLDREDVGFPRASRIGSECEQNDEAEQARAKHAEPYDAADRISFSGSVEAGGEADPDKPLEVVAEDSDGRITDVTAVDASGRHVAGELAQVNAGAITQSTQAGILETLQELLDAVKKLQEQQQAGQGGMMAGGGAGEAPLVPTSAELRMLKTSQLRVNQQTDVAAEALQKGDADPAEVTGALQRASARQAQLKDMARELQERAEKGR